MKFIHIMNKLVGEGMSIIMISSELPEILGMSDRIYIVSSGKIAGELPIEEATQEKIMQLATELRRLQMTFFSNLKKLLRQNIREYGMYIALFVIMAIFTVTTNGTLHFVQKHQQPDESDRLYRRPGSRHDAGDRHPAYRSVGRFSGGFLGAIAAIALLFWHLPVVLVIPTGAGAGDHRRADHRFPGGADENPFLCGIAGRLADLPGSHSSGHRREQARSLFQIAFFNAIGNGFIPDIPDIGVLPGVHKLTLILGLIAIVLFIINEIQRPQKETGLQL